MMWAVAVVLAWQVGVMQPITITDVFAPGVLATAAANDWGRLPLVCGEPLTHTVQFVWRAAPGEVVDEAGVEQKLRVIAEQVTWLFWRDSDGWGPARVPVWKMTADCRLDILYLTDATTMPEGVRTKHVIVEDAPDYCGKAVIIGDERAGPENYNNLSSVAWVARHCLNAYVVAHEVLHALGAVQLGAPGSDDTWHTVDVLDVMSRHLLRRCEYLMVDCGHDDYFSGQASGYLAGHWNAWNSLYLRDVAKYRLLLHPVYLGGMPSGNADTNMAEEDH